MFREGLRPPDPFPERDVLEIACTQDGMSLKTLSEMAPALVVCLPEAAGRALAEVAAQRAAIERAGARVVLVFCGPEPDLARHDLAYVARIADPERRLYERFGLGETRRWLRRPVQEGGAFLLVAGEVKGAAASDYLSLLG